MFEFFSQDFFKNSHGSHDRICKRAKFEVKLFVFKTLVRVMKSQLLDSNQAPIHVIRRGNLAFQVP